MASSSFASRASDDDDSRDEPRSAVASSSAAFSAAASATRADRSFCRSAFAASACAACADVTSASCALIRWRASVSSSRSWPLARSAASARSDASLLSFAASLPGVARRLRKERWDESIASRALRVGRAGPGASSTESAVRPTPPPPVAPRSPPLNVSPVHSSYACMQVEPWEMTSTDSPGHRSASARSVRSTRGRIRSYVSGLASMYDSSSNATAGGCAEMATSAPSVAPAWTAGSAMRPPAGVAASGRAGCGPFVCGPPQVESAPATAQCPNHLSLMISAIPGSTATSPTPSARAAAAAVWIARTKGDETTRVTGGTSSRCAAAAQPAPSARPCRAPSAVSGGSHGRSAFAVQLLPASRSA